MFKLVLEKAEKPEIKLPTSVGSWKKEESSRKTSAAAKLLQSCPTLCDPIDSSPPGSSILGILQARILEWVAISLSKKNIFFCFIDCAKGFDCVDDNNYGKFWKRWEYQTTWPASSETYMQVRKQQLELDIEQQTGSKLGKEYVKTVYCHPAYLTYMQST